MLKKITQTKCIFLLIQQSARARVHVYPSMDEASSNDVTGSATVRFKAAETETSEESEEFQFTGVW